MHRTTFSEVLTTFKKNLCHRLREAAPHSTLPLCVRHCEKDWMKSRYVCRCSWRADRAADWKELVAGRRAWWRRRSRDTGYGSRRVDVECRRRRRTSPGRCGCCRGRRGYRCWHRHVPTSPTWPAPSDLPDTSAASTFLRRWRCGGKRGWNLHHRQPSVITSHRGHNMVAEFETQLFGTLRRFFYLWGKTVFNVFILWTTIYYLTFFLIIIFLLQMFRTTMVRDWRSSRSSMTNWIPSIQRWQQVNKWAIDNK